MALNLIMLGAPGAGKGTQADRVAVQYGIPKISTGDMLREAVRAGTDIGLRAKAIMDRGELVSDDVMIGIVRERLDRADAKAGFILDGFPRTVAQAQSLDSLMDGRDALAIIDIRVPEDELVRRLTGRVICQNCGQNAEGVSVAQMAQTVCTRCGGPLKQRADDTDAVVRDRLAVYTRNTQPLVEFYQGRPTFRSIDGAQSFEQVTAAMKQALVDVQSVAGVSR